MSFDGALQDHSQWFSPLGSSASRFTQDPPALIASAPPVIFSGVPISGSDARGRGICSPGQEELSSSAQQGSRHGGATLAPLGQVYHQPSSSSHRQATAQAASGSVAGSFSQTRIGGASLGSWVAFGDSAQSAMPSVSSHLQAAWNPPLEQLPTSAETTRTAAPAQHAASSAGVPVALSGTTSDQGPTFVPAFHTAASGSSSAQAVVSPASDQLQDTSLAMPLPQTQNIGAALNGGKGPSQAADFDLLHWDRAHGLGQSASSAAQDRDTSGSLLSSAATAASTQLATKTRVPLRLQAPACRDNGSASPSSGLAQPSAEGAIGAKQASTWPSAEAGRAHNELQSLKHEVRLCMLREKASESCTLILEAQHSALAHNSAWLQPQSSV